LKTLQVYKEKSTFVKTFINKMIKKHFLHIIFFLFLLIHSTVSYGQYIIAGQHGAKDVYTDLMPGSIVSMMNCAPVYYCSDDLDLDINKDGIIDLKIVSGGGGGLGGGSSSTIIESLNPDNFVSTFPDSSYWNPFSYVVVNTAIAYSPGDSISSLLRFTNSSPLYYNSNTSYIFASHYGNFASPSVAYWNGIGEHFIAVKLIVQNSALFGWIRVQVDNSGQITIKDYACNFTIPKEVLLFPNPANEELHIRFTNSESQTITIGGF